MTSTTVTSLVRPAPSHRAKSLAPVRAWLLLLAVLVIVMAGLGAATRLTGSGLSITEWRPVTGVVPPLFAEAWAAEFEKYRATPQYDLLNRGMGLEDFKTIFWWEWAHRLLGRVIGVAFFLPLLWFFARGVVRGKLALLLFGLGALGGLQVAVGWIIVASGLQPGMVAVAPLKLTFHLTIACLILAGLVWIAAGLSERPREAATPGVRVGARALLALVLVQVALGGLVAGSKAGLTYNTWPLMDGALVPPTSALFALSPGFDNLVANVTLVQFNHRMVAYLVVAAAIFHALAAGRAMPGSGAAKRARVLAGLALMQMALGIATLVLVVPLWAGLAHQAAAMALVGMAAAHARLTGAARESSPEAAAMQARREGGDSARAGSSRL